MSKDQIVIPIERIAASIYLIRGEKVMLDSDLAALYNSCLCGSCCRLFHAVSVTPDSHGMHIGCRDLSDESSQVAAS
jgi:hypothetical protein